MALAQGTLPDVQKAAQPAPDVALSAIELGLPADEAAPKTAGIGASRAEDSTPSDFDTDKIAGNAPVAAPLAQRTKVPGTLPDPAPAARDLGFGPDGEKVAVLDASKAADGRATTNDSDKIDGNPETFPPLAARQKAPALLPEGVSEADFGLPANPDAPKTADLAGRHSEGHPSIYDEDKIDGNEPPPAPLTDRQKAPSFPETAVAEADLGLPANPDAPKSAEFAAFYTEGVPTAYDEDKITGNGESADPGSEFGPLSDRQKLPSDLAEGADPSTFGQPVIDAAKEADLGVSKAGTAVTSIEDNDKIAGNPYIAPPLTPRQKAPAVMPDPVADADMGQPAIDAPKVDLAVSKVADGRPSVNDNDKIDGNPVVSPPLGDRSKAPAYEPALAGLSDADLGLPAAPDAVKTADIAESKAQGAVTTEYDEDKIAGNTYQDPSFDTDDGYDDFETTLSPELLAQVRAVLDDPATRDAMLAGLQLRDLPPGPAGVSILSFYTAVFDTPATKDRMAPDIAHVFRDIGIAPENPAAVGRMAAEYIAGFGEAEAARGTARRSISEQRAYLGDALRIADTLTAEQCGPYLDGSMDAAQQRSLMLAAIASWPDGERDTILANRAAAIIAEVQDDPAFVPLPDRDAQTARQALGAVALAAIDAAENGPDLLAAYGNPDGASPADHCAVQKLLIGAALAGAGPDADLAVRYLVEYGWQN